MILTILAAGMGSRFGGNKQMAPVGPNGETIMDYAIYDAIQAGFEKVVFIIRPELEELLQAHFSAKLAGKIEVAFAHQEMHQPFPEKQGQIDRQKPWGTGHAILATKAHINEPFAVINADDFYGTATFQLIGDFLRKDVAPTLFGLAAFEARRTMSAHGNVNRGICYTSDNQLLTGITESKLKLENNKILAQIDSNDWQMIADETAVSMNCWGFHPTIFEQLESGFIDFLATKNLDKKAEYLLPEMIGKGIENNTIAVQVLQSKAQWYGMTYREELPLVQAAMANYIASGQYPASLWA